MRARSVLLVIAIAVVAIFTLLNWQEFTRPTTLNLGWRTATAPLGLLLLGLLGLTLIAYLVSSASSHTRMLMESRQQAKALQAQRELADKAEASRFTDLRQALDAHLRDTRTREAEFDKGLANHQRELRNQLEQMNRSISMRLGELEARLDSRLGHSAPVGGMATSHVAASHAPVQGTAVRSDTYREETLRVEPVGTVPLRPQPVHGGDQPAGSRHVDETERTTTRVVRASDERF